MLLCLWVSTAPFTMLFYFKVTKDSFLYAALFQTSRGPSSGCQWSSFWQQHHAVECCYIWVGGHWQNCLFNCDLLQKVAFSKHVSPSRYIFPACPQSSLLTEPLWIDLGLIVEMMCQSWLISTLKKKGFKKKKEKRVHVENDLSIITPKFSHARKIPYITPTQIR